MKEDHQLRILEHIILPTQAGRTVKSIARAEMHLSSTQFRSLKFQGAVLVDGKIARADERLQPGQKVTLILKDQGTLPAPFDLPLSIPYQDRDYFIVDKPAPLPSLCSAHQQGGTLENALYSHLGCPEDYVYRPVNRLDKGTSGLMAVARNAHAQQLLQKMLHTEGFVREYLAVCEGEVDDAAGVIDLPILEPETGIKRRIDPAGRPARTHYRVEEIRNGKTLLRLRLETGRTHQIRVHLAHLGHPICGDYLYGREDERLCGRFALHSCFIRFLHPITECEVTVNSPLPDEIRTLFI